ncbi:hypothetical protein, partial [Paraburkholderia sp. BR14320]|uniref:hypothetical protein n=1 Tax=unclassified Paraburkholderia TaxID=2615204 RepID=UPI0034D00EB5
MEQLDFERVCKIDPTRLQENMSYPADEMLITGKPKRISRPLVDFEPSRSGVGFWEAEVGAWKFVYPSNRNEIFHVLEGTFSLESETTPQTEFSNRLLKYTRVEEAPLQLRDSRRKIFRIVQIQCEFTVPLSVLRP